METVVPSRHSHYLQVIQSAILLNKGIKGYKGKLAKAACCHPSFLSQVLKSQVLLTSDQAFGLQVFWNLEPLEAQYFGNLVEMARSANRARIQCLEKQNSEIHRQISTLAAKLNKEQVQKTEPDWNLYYSSWHYAAVHMATTIESFQTVETIAQRLQISEALVFEVLKTLESMSLVVKSRQSNRWFASVRDHFVDKKSIHNLHHQRNLRNRLTSGDTFGEREVFYGGIYSIDRETASHIKEILTTSILKSRSAALEAKVEDLYGIHIDFYRL